MQHLKLQTWDCLWGKAPLHQNKPAVDKGKLGRCLGQQSLEEMPPRRWNGCPIAYFVDAEDRSSFSFFSSLPVLNTTYMPQHKDYTPSIPST